LDRNARSVADGGDAVPNHQRLVLASGRTGPVDHPDMAQHDDAGVDPDEGVDGVGERWTRGDLRTLPLWRFGSPEPILPRRSADRP